MWIYLLIIPVGFLLGSVILPSFWGGAWSPTPMGIVNQMLDMAQFKEGETLFDLGAGDGRVVVRAASAHPINAVGVEIDPFKCFLLKTRVRFKGLCSRVKIVKGDFFKVDLSEADVVFLYLSPAAHYRLRDKLSRELGEGARVVCYRRPMSGWQLEAVSPSRNLYLYRIVRNAAHSTANPR